MTSTVAGSSARSAPTAGWWGDGAPPWERWPGVSLRLDATWSAERGRWESPCGRYYFDRDAADRPAAFMSTYLRQTKGEWAHEPLELLPWQRLLLVDPLFGWLRVEDGSRRFRRVFVEVPKKNGKSTLCSGLGLYLAFGDMEPGAEVYAAAGDEEQARIVWGDSATMAEESPEFIEDGGIEVLAGSIVQASSNSFFKPLTAKASSKHGFNIHALIFDELHAQKSRKLYETLKRGVSARRQPVILVITTAGDDRESICYEEHEYACGVRDGTLAHEDPEFLPVVFQLGPDDDWRAEENWMKANPSLGVTKFLDYMRAECVAAQNEPRKRNDFLRLELNVWTESRTVWIPPEEWDACRAPEPMEGLADLPCVLGVDLSTRVDLTACVAVFRRPDRSRAALEVALADPESTAEQRSARRLVLDYTVDVVPYFFIPAGVLAERVRKDGVRYDLWAADGWLRVTDGDVTDTVELYRFISEDLRKRYRKVRQIAYDPWHAADLASNLQRDGAPVVQVRQGMRSLSQPSLLLEALVRSRRIRHDGNPVMGWCVANAEVDTDENGNIRPVKPGKDARSTRRIDGVVALVTALSQLMLLPDESPGSSRVRTLR